MHKAISNRFPSNKNVSLAIFRLLVMDLQNLTRYKPKHNSYNFENFLYRPCPRYFQFQKKLQSY